MIPRAFWLTRIITCTTGLGLQLAGVYAAVATFGVWSTLGLLGVGTLAVVPQHIVSRRTTCSLGD